MCQCPLGRKRISPALSPAVILPQSPKRVGILLASSFLLLTPLGCLGTGGTRLTTGWRNVHVPRLTSQSFLVADSATSTTKQSMLTAPDTFVPEIQQTGNLQEAPAATPSPSNDSTDGTARDEETFSAATQSWSNSPAGITLAELEAIALGSNPTLRQSQAAIASERGYYHQAGLYPNPTIGYLNSSASSPGVKDSNGFYYSQEIPTARKLQLAQNASAIEIQRYSWDNESQRQRVLNDLRIRYFEVLGAQESLKVAEEVLKISEDIDQMVVKSAERGERSKSDTLEARRQLARSRLARDEAQDRLQAAWQQLATMMGCSPMQPVPILDELARDIPQLDFETCWQELRSNSPQLHSTECDFGHATATYHSAVAQAYPNLTVQVVSEYDRVTQAATVSSLIAVPLPVTNRNQGNIEKSAADIQAARAEIARVELVLHDQLVDSFRRYKQQFRVTESLRTSILESTRESLEIAKRVYQSGDTGIGPVLLAQQEYHHSQTQYVEALTDLHKAAIEIQGLQLTGGLNPASIGSAIQNSPGGGQRQRALLNETQSVGSKQLLPAAQIAQ